MIIGCKIPEKFATQSATARFDRSYAGQQDSSWLDRAAAQFRAAITLNIPAGYQDEAGFHCGEPVMANSTSVSPERSLESFQK